QLSSPTIHTTFSDSSPPPSTLHSLTALLPHRPHYILRQLSFPLHPHYILWQFTLHHLQCTWFSERFPAL
ncbi:unnamed protein product, partial [Staurois parvus]